MIFAAKLPYYMSFLPEEDLEPEDYLDLKVFSAIEDLVINQILLDAGQITQEEFQYEKQRQLKVIYRGCQDFLETLKQPVSHKIIQEMVDGVFALEIFLPILKSDYLTGTVEEKDKIVRELDFKKLNKDTYALVTNYLKRKGYFKKSKGFGK